MALQASGAISLQDVQNEYGGSHPISISEYYGRNGIPSSGVISLGTFHGKSNIIPFVAGTRYVNNGSKTSSLTSSLGSYSLHRTVWDYRQSGNIFTFTVGSIAAGTLRFQATADPDNAPRSNSGNDRQLILRRNGSNIASVWAGAYRNAVLNTVQTANSGDVFTLYMNNSGDWRDLGGFERIKSIYITGV